MKEKTIHSLTDSVKKEYLNNPLLPTTSSKTAVSFKGVHQKARQRRLQKQKQRLLIDCVSYSFLLLLFYLTVKFI
jgi:hypothetical protein